MCVRWWFSPNLSLSQHLSRSLLILFLSFQGHFRLQWEVGKSLFSVWSLDRAQYVVRHCSKAVQFCTMLFTHARFLVLLVSPLAKVRWQMCFITLVSNSMIRYTDISMGGFLCPLFRGCTVCVTGLSSLDRKEVQRLTIENGGQYSGQLKMNECTHLIVQDPKGKYPLKCMSFLWLERLLVHV